MSDDYAYPIDVDSIRRAFPPGTEAPPLLMDFAGWLKGRDWGNAGCYELIGDFSDNAPIVDGSPLRDQFALFMRLPEGSVVGTWYGAGAGVEQAPVVVLGSEGEHDIIAASLAGLLAKIAMQRFEEDGAWTDFSPHEDAEDETGELADWLAGRLRLKDLRSLTAPPRGLPDFKRRMETWCRDREGYWATHPSMARLSNLLSARRPRGKNPWERTRFEIAIAGRQFQARVSERGFQPIDETPAIEPVLRELREQMWRDKPALGLWYSMGFFLHADGRIVPRFDYQTLPLIDDAPADMAELRADLARAPRPERWVPGWLKP